MQLKIGLYCQHVLGIGHFHRSLEICSALARDHDVTLITGGPPVAANFTNLHHLQLPSLQMDENFSTLVPCAPNGATLDEIKEKRKTMLRRWFIAEKPNVFITELYPFGRKAFRFELDPILEEIQTGKLDRCLCCSSVRDILVEKETGRDKFEKRVVETLNNFFDQVFVHADRDIIALEATFGRVDEIKIPIRYTGFIGKEEREKANNHTSPSEYIPESAKVIVASIGGGNVGHTFLHRVIDAFKLAMQVEPDLFLQIFCGPYCPEQEYRLLSKQNSTHIRVSRFTDNFPGWLQRATLSISMGGYNTCMDVLKAGTPALIYPFAQNREQRMRAELLRSKAPITLLSEDDLQPMQLAEYMKHGLHQPHQNSPIKINGAEQTARHLLKAYKELCGT